MELPHVGKNCAKKGCEKLDFLPMLCDYCRQVFCSAHGSIAGHACSYERPTDDRQHKSKHSVPISYYTKPQRVAPDHASKLQKNTLSAEQIQALSALKQTSSTISRSTNTPKHKPRISPKIELMRLKARATGNASIDMADRLYLSVVWKEKSAPVYINKNAVIGSSAMQFARNLHLSMLPEKIYFLKTLHSNDPLPSNKAFSELLVDSGKPYSSSDVEIFNGCTLELVCLAAPKNK